MKKYLYFLAIVFMLLFFSGQAFAQSGTTGAIEGKVFDEEGSPLPGVEVKLSSPDLIGGTQAKLTTAVGKYRFVALPRGTYVVEASLPGFTAARRENILLFVGQTITIDLILKIGALEEEVTVVGSAPLVDVKDSMINATNLDLQILQTVGSETRSKSPNALINFAPGVLDSSAMGAAESVSNQYHLDGQSLNTWIGAGDWWNSPDLNIIEEVQVSGSGASAEYSGFTGAVLNLITKSGGNTFEGLAEVSYSALSWGAENVDLNEPKFSLYEYPPRNRYFDAHFGLGGPIIKDKLWFYVSAGYVKTDDEIQDFKELQTYKNNKFFGKLTFQPNSTNRISAWIEYEKFKSQNIGLGVTRPLEATWVFSGPSFPIAINWLHTFSENTFTEIKVGRFEGLDERMPINGRDVSSHYDYLTGMYSGNGGYYWIMDTTHWNASATLSHHADDFIAGSHDFKVGVEFLTGVDNGAYGYPGEGNYYDNVYGYSYYYYDYRYLSYNYTYGYDSQSKGTKVSGFAQDSWKISDRLTFNPGVRWTMFRGYLPNLQDDAFFKPKNTLEFRLGLTFDVFGDHTTAIKAHYGRFYESFKTWYFSGADPSISDWVMYEILADGTKYEVYRESYSVQIDMDPNIKIPHSDQFTFGLERTLLKDTTISLNFVHRVYKDFIARVSTGTLWELTPWTYEDENGQEQSIDIYRLLPGSGDSMMITNPIAGQYQALILTPKNKYTGFSISLNKRFSDGWMFHIDYTYSVAKGTHANTWDGGAWGDYYYSNPNRQINGDGRLVFDAPHALHAYGTVTLPWNIIFSPRFLFRSGMNWTRTITGPSWAGSKPTMLEERGSQRLPNRYDFDLRLEKVFAITDRMRLGFIFDMFNVINQGVETAVGVNVRRADFRKAISVNDARSFRVGLRFMF
jgi:outer membrane receptor protein involved in Fe transport